MLTKKVQLKYDGWIDNWQTNGIRLHLVHFIDTFQFKEWRRFYKYDDLPEEMKAEAEHDQAG